MTLRVGWFSTGAGPTSQRWRMLSAVQQEIEAARLDAELSFVFSHRERGEDEGSDAFFDYVEAQRIPLITLSSRSFRRERAGELSRPGEPLPAWRTDYDRRVAELVAPYEFDVGMLAGYMLIFTPEMARRHPFLNLHPAAPDGPVGTWQQVIHELISTGAARSGVMVHLATEHLDRGPVVAYCTYPLRGGDFDRLWADQALRELGEADPLFLAIRQRGAALEVPLVVATLRAIVQNRVGAINQMNETVGLDLTDEVYELAMGR